MKNGKWQTTLAHLFTGETFTLKLGRIWIVGRNQPPGLRLMRRSGGIVETLPDDPRNWQALVERCVIATIAAQLCGMDHASTVMLPPEDAAPSPVQAHAMSVERALIDDLIPYLNSHPIQTPAIRDLSAFLPPFAKGSVKGEFARRLAEGLRDGKNTCQQ